MTFRSVYCTFVAVLLCLLLGIWLHGSMASWALVMAGASLVGWVSAKLIHPWLGTRVYYRVRYRVSDATLLPSTAIGEGLSTLAKQGGAVSIMWRREAGELLLFMEVPASMDEALRGMLPRLLPQLSVEAVPAPAPLSGAAGIYRWSLAQAGAGGSEDPLNFDNLLSDAILRGEFELGVHFVAEGASVIAQGALGKDGAAAGLRSIWRPLWRVAMPRPRTSLQSQPKITH